MKQFRQFAALLLSLVLILGMTASAFAGTVSKTIKIDNSVEGYTYDAYEIFDGTDNGEGKLSDITWGTGVDSAALLSALAADPIFGEAFTTTMTAMQAADVLTTFNTSTAAIEAFAEHVFDCKATKKASSVATAVDPYEITVDEGYYLVFDSVVPDGAVHTKYLLTVAKSASPADLKIQPKKTTTPDITKTANGTTYAKNDDVTFTITATLPGDYSAYDYYQLKVTDNLSTGLALSSGSIVVKYGATELTAGTDYTITTATSSMFVIDLGASTTNESGATIYDVKSMTGATAADNGVFTITYKAELTADVITTTSGIVNTAKLTYSNDPNDGGNGDKVTDGVPVEENVYTLQILIHKVDDETTPQPLEGAVFTLYKTDGTTVSALTVSGTGTDHTLTGLKEGTYVLKETTTPTGYNTMEPVTFTIAATDTDGELTALSATGLSGATYTLKDGLVEATVQNRSGNVLPETGGIGTKLFITCGGFAAMMAAIFLVTNKRMSKEEF